MYDYSAPIIIIINLISIIKLHYACECSFFVPRVYDGSNIFYRTCLFQLTSCRIHFRFRRINLCIKRHHSTETDSQDRHTHTQRGRGRERERHRDNYECNAWLSGGWPHIWWVLRDSRSVKLRSWNQIVCWCCGLSDKIASDKDRCYRNTNFLLCRSSITKGRLGKTQNGRFPSKIALFLKKVCYKISLCENCQRQSCNVFIGLTIRAKMIANDWKWFPRGEIWRILTNPLAKRQFLIYFRS